MAAGVFGGEDGSPIGFAAEGGDDDVGVHAVGEQPYGDFGLAFGLAGAFDAGQQPNGGAVEQEEGGQAEEAAADEAGEFGHGSVRFEAIVN